MLKMNLQLFAHKKLGLQGIEEEYMEYIDVIFEEV